MVDCGDLNTRHGKKTGTKEGGQETKEEWRDEVREVRVWVTTNYNKLEATNVVHSADIADKEMEWEPIFDLAVFVWCYNIHEARKLAGTFSGFMTASYIAKN